MPLVPSYIKKLKSYKPGKSIVEAQREFELKSFIKLASNENPYGPSPKSMEAINKASHKIHRYPDATGFELRNTLAQKYNLDVKNVILGSGSEGIMSTIMRTFLLKDDELISASNSFIGFKVLANASGCKTHWVPMKNNRYDLKKISKKINDYTKIIYIANPDNPMGTFITKSEFDKFYKSVPDRVLIILDEAYFEYAKDFEGYPNSMNYRYDNVITLRTFSKAYGLAGIRVGYGFAHDSLIENLLKVKAPFEPSLLGQIAASAALSDHFFLEKSIKMNNIGIKYLEGEFTKEDIRFISSSTNFITTIWPSEKIANQISHKLLKKGFIVRQLTAFGSPNYIRISVGLEDENIKFIKAIKDII
tara:strand:+ start:1406 stop:2491 length:1086 start_codon:yes stop_codon:yes gene_type:complete